MNKVTYLTELGQRLAPLPLTPEDINDAMRFYEEYFDEAGPEREQAVMEELGSPAYVAAQIALKLSSSPTPLTEVKKGLRNHASLWRTVLIGVLAAPVALPLVFAGVMVILSLMITAAILIFVFGLSGFVCIIAGVLTLFFSIGILFSDFAAALYFVGVGLLFFGLGGAMAHFGSWLGKLCYKGVALLGARIFRQGKTSGADASYTSGRPYCGTAGGESAFENRTN